MSNRSLLPDTIEAYVGEVIPSETPVRERLREETAALPNARMQIGPDQAAFLGLLIRLIGARRALEIGTFTGLSAMAIASALPEGGKLIACDVNEEWTRIARRYWEEAGLTAKIELRLAPALKTLAELKSRPGAGSFDFAFIDADKANYANYFERCLTLIRPGGLIAVDNVLWSGQVADPAVGDEDTRAIRAFNEKLKNDQRIWLSMLPIRDGLTLACKKG